MLSLTILYCMGRVASASATDAQVRSILQNLLVTRFGLASHLESKEAQGYAGFGGGADRAAFGELSSGECYVVMAGVGSDVFVAG